MLDANQFRELIIKPTLRELVLYSDAAVELMMFTCAVESNGGTYIKQTNGPALGIYQMEPDTYNDLWQNFIKYKHNISLLLISNFEIYSMPSEDRLIYDLRFATAMTRLHYFRVPHALPAVEDVDGIWQYYKDHYNSSLGKAEKNSSIKKYHDFTSR
jgi:hypothetical protein